MECDTNNSFKLDFEHPQFRHMCALRSIIYFTAWTLEKKLHFWHHPSDSVDNGPLLSTVMHTKNGLDR